MITDALNYLDCGSVIDKIKYSNFMHALKTPQDWGALSNIYVNIHALGNFTTGTTLTVEVMAAIKDDLSDGFVLTSTGAVKQADIVYGWARSLIIPEIGKKYKYIYLRYAPESATEEAGEDKNPIICPTEPLIPIKDGEVENGFTSYISPTKVRTGIYYPHANQNMIITG